MLAIVTVIGAYGGHIEPQSMPIASLLTMLFPILMVACAAVAVIDLLFKRQLAIIPAVAIVASIGPMLTVSPVHKPHAPLTEDEMPRKFTVLTYNVLNFIDNQGIYPDSTNRTISYILSTDADIVCLQECEYLCPMPMYCVTKAQVDSLLDRYPYRHIGKNGQSLLSKFPFLPIPMHKTEKDNAAFTAYRTNVYGHVVTIFNVHLQSLGLTTSDRELFLSLTSLDRQQSLDHIRSQIVSKLFDGFIQRAEQADRIAVWVKAFDDNSDIILCGDFNDVPLSYAYRTIIGAGLSDAYAEAALGPTITYNSNRFYFHIDQMMYHGELSPVSVERGNIPSSDHYPIFATFLWDKNLRRYWNFNATSMPIDTTYYKTPKRKR